MNISTNTLIIILVVCLLCGALPTWRYSRDWGYGPSGIIGVIAIILLCVLLFTGRIH